MIITKKLSIHKLLLDLLYVSLQSENSLRNFLCCFPPKIGHEVSKPMIFSRRTHNTKSEKQSYVLNSTVLYYNVIVCTVQYCVAKIC